MSKANRKFIIERRTEKINTFLTDHPEFMNRNGQQKLLYPAKED